MRSIIAGELPTVLHAVVSEHDTRIVQSEKAAKGILTAHNNLCMREGIECGGPMKRYMAVIEAWIEVE